MNRSLYKKSGIGKMRKTKKRKEGSKKVNRQNRIAMLSITFVVGVLFVAMMMKSVNLQEQISGYQDQISDLDSQIEEEKDRTAQIDDMKDYMKTDEYAEEIAREKLGLVKDNEIVFKEQE